MSFLTPPVFSWTECEPHLGEGQDFKWEVVPTTLPALDPAWGLPRELPSSSSGLSLKAAGNGEWVPGSPGIERPLGWKSWACSLWGSVNSNLHAAPCWSSQKWVTLVWNNSSQTTVQWFSAGSQCLSGVPEVQKYFFFIIITVYLVKFFQIYRCKVHWPVIQMPHWN